jgi:hypothetical protein
VTNPVVQQRPSAAPDGVPSPQSYAPSPQAAAPDLSAEAIIAARSAQPRHQFTIPPNVRGPNDPSTVVLLELTSGQEETAAKIAGDDSSTLRLASEMCKLALYKVDGRLVDHANAEAEFYWARWSTKVRRLIQSAIGKIHNTTKEEDDAFFASQTPARG